MENNLHRKNLFRKTYIFGAINGKNKFRRNFFRNQFLPLSYEKLVLKQMTEFVKKQHIYHLYQLGYIKNHRKTTHTFNETIR